MIKFKNGEYLEVSNQIEKITVEKINICIFAPDEENMHIMYQPTSGTSIKARKYPIVIEGESCSVSRIKRNILQFMEELYESLDYIEYKGIISIGVPSTLIYCYKLVCTNGYWNQELLEFMDVIHDLVFSCNDESYEKYKQKLLDDFKDAFMSFKPKVYTEDWLDAIRYFDNEIIKLKENEKMPIKTNGAIWEFVNDITGEKINLNNEPEKLEVTEFCFDDFIVSVDIDRVVFNDPATIVFWKDGSKTVVKADEEKFDKEKGLAMAIAKKVYGNKGNYYNVFKKWIKEDK